MKTLSKADQLKLRALEAGFQGFEADAFKHCLRRFELEVRSEYEVAAWMDEDGRVMSDSVKQDPKHKEFLGKDQPFSGYDTPLYRRKHEQQTI